MIESHHTYKAGSKEQKDLDYILFLPDDIDIMFITFESRSLLLSKVVYFRK